MKRLLHLLFFLALGTFAFAQQTSSADGVQSAKRFQLNTNTNWYSENISNGVIIQNSFPKGGPYTGPTERHFDYTYLVFFSRVANETATPVELTIDFSGDSIAIPGSPDTYVKLFLPPDTMTVSKQILFGFGVKALQSLDEPTRFQRTIEPNDDCLFNVVAVFYRTTPAAESQARGGNRAEFYLNGEELFFSMPPQIVSLSCGRIIAKN